MSIFLKIMSPSAVMLDEAVRSVVLPSPSGELGILAKRQQLLVRLKKGALRYETLSGEKLSLPVEGGLAYNDGEIVTVLLR